MTPRSALLSLEVADNWNLTPTFRVSGSFFSWFDSHGRENFGVRNEESESAGERENQKAKVKEKE